MYEDDDDRKAEREIIGVIAAQWKCEAKKVPPKYGFDYLLLRDGVGKAIVEIKARPDRTMEWFDQKGGYMISAHKIERCLAFSALARVPFFLAVRCANLAEILTTKVTQDRLLMSWRLGFFEGYTEPRREDDKEPAFYIPTAQFKLFPEV